MPFIEPIRNWYGRYERPISSLSLILGFVFDIVTLKRLDTFWENSWILAHLFIVGIFIILIHIQDSDVGDEGNPSKMHFWYVNILQFFFGGLLSTYLVFYFRSADILVAWPFILILVLAFIANESLKRHYVRFSFQISLFFLSIYCFSIFLVPIVLHKIGAWVFLLSGLLSLLLIAFFILVLFYFIKDKNNHAKTESMKMILLSIFGIFFVVNFLYFTNLIPPIPLSLKDAGVYHSIKRNSEGNYDVTYEDHGWRGYFKLYPNFSKMSSESVYAYSAVFSPRGLDLNILHEWQFYNEKTGKWKTETKVKLPVVGGRDNGFRTYSMRSNLASGKWRVNIKTTQGHTIGHLRFAVVGVGSGPTLSSGVKE